MKVDLKDGVYKAEATLYIVDGKATVELHRDFRLDFPEGCTIPLAREGCNIIISDEKNGHAII